VPTNDHCSDLACPGPPTGKSPNTYPQTSQPQFLFLFLPQFGGKTKPLWWQNKATLVAALPRSIKLHGTSCSLSLHFCRQRLGMDGRTDGRTDANVVVI